MQFGNGRLAKVDSGGRTLLSITVAQGVRPQGRYPGDALLVVHLGPQASLTDVPKELVSAEAPQHPDELRWHTRTCVSRNVRGRPHAAGAHVMSGAVMDEPPCPISQKSQ